MNKRPVFFALLTLILAMLACVGGGGGTDPRSCTSVKVDTIKDSFSIVDVLGTFTNNCDQEIQFAEIQTTCFSSSGAVLDRDPEYVENVPPGAKAYYDAVISATPSQVDRCSSEITQARFK